MKVALSLRNESQLKRLYRRDDLTRLAEKVCAGEGLRGAAEVSVLLCDDAFIRDLNKRFRKKDKATDVLSFEQVSPPGSKIRLLGDIVISLETVARFCHDERSAMRDELRLLFCHGLLHLLGHDHATKKEQEAMQARQSKYLGVDWDAAWREREEAFKKGAPVNARGGGDKRLGR